MGKCIACQNWKLKVKNENGDYKPHGMAKHHMGYCAHGEEWQYYGSNHECHNSRFSAIEEQIFLKRLQWVNKKD